MACSRRHHSLPGNRGRPDPRHRAPRTRRGRGLRCRAARDRAGDGSQASRARAFHFTCVSLPSAGSARPGAAVCRRSAAAGPMGLARRLSAGPDRGPGALPEAVLTPGTPQAQAVEAKAAEPAERSRAWYWIVAGGLAAVLLYYSLRGVAWGRVWQTILGAR